MISNNRTNVYLLVLKHSFVSHHGRPPGVPTGPRCGMVFCYSFIQSTGCGLYFLKKQERVYKLIRKRMEKSKEEWEVYLKAASLFICWLVFPPLYIILSKYFTNESLRRRWGFTLISPFGLIFMICLCIFFVFCLPPLWEYAVDDKLPRSWVTFRNRLRFL